MKLESRSLDRLVTARRSWLRLPHAAVPVAAMAAVLVGPYSGFAAQGTDAKANQCIACHEIEQLPITLGHSFGEWKASEHARSGVACEKCHGGDPSATQMEAAHKGILPSSDPASRTSSRNVAATCGTCHKDQFHAYEGTTHAKEFRQDTVAATCVTCHGAMATSLPSPAEITSRCIVCHDKPVEARAALSWLVAAKIQLYKTKQSLDAAQAAVPDWHADAIKRFHDMEQSYHKVTVDWHSFDLQRSLHESQDILNLAKLLDGEARLKLKMKKGANTDGAHDDADHKDH
ncbi:MAG TPA: multiheme c-type cytochrome [Candidatus Binatia bacterium]